ncbi:acetylglucosamine transferase [Izhakiella australiensis]|uniref:Acetylglucosamine transferase n=1 Tax=Izhakiella australiensis TaxID=1926881 RepID=A0A1S8YPR9_9GAMM|nr:glycosyltransferase family 4 protein [Izhakiella australiensis]OON41054.1 acetylglucosamine transferase [Izhakiella australiensis]
MKKNVKYVFFFESSKNIGGQEWQLLQQMESLNKSGFTTLLFCKADSRIDSEARLRQLAIINAPFRNSCHPSTIAIIRKAIKQYRPAACICHSGHDANNLSIATMLMANRPKLIRSRTYYTARKASLINRLLPLDLVMVPSRFMSEKLHDHFPGKKMQVVYPGIAFSKLDQEQHLPLDAGLDDWLKHHAGDVIVQLGMLREEKGHRIILDALKELVKKRPGVRYVIAGSGNEAPLREYIAANGLQPNVWIGELSSVAALLMRASIVVMPSKKEPLGMAQIEALGLAVPVIISNQGGLPETVTDGVSGIIVTTDTAEAWSQAIDFALSQPALMREYALAGQKDVRARFSCQTNTEALIDIITQRHTSSRCCQQCHKKREWYSSDHRYCEECFHQHIRALRDSSKM